MWQIGECSNRNLLVHRANSHKNRDLQGWPVSAAIRYLYRLSCSVCELLCPWSRSLCVTGIMTWHGLHMRAHACFRACVHAGARTQHTHAFQLVSSSLCSCVSVTPCLQEAWLHVLASAKCAGTTGRRAAECACSANGGRRRGASPSIVSFGSSTRVSWACAGLVRTGIFRMQCDSWRGRFHGHWNW